MNVNVFDPEVTFQIVAGLRSAVGRLAERATPDLTLCADRLANECGC